MQSLSDVFVQVGADEGTLWKLSDSGNCLIPLWNSGPRAAEIVGHHRQPLTRGLLATVCITGHGICENSVHRSGSHDPTLDQKLNVQTSSMLAVPWMHEGGILGAVSCVKLQPGSDSSACEPFTISDLRLLELAVSELPNDPFP